MSRLRIQHGPRAAGRTLTAAIMTMAGIALAGAPAAGAFEPLAQYGEPGTGAGGLAGAQGIGIDGNGNFAVAQMGNNRVSTFDRAGNFVNAFGADVIPGGAATFEVCTAATTCGPGAGNTSAGSLNGPWDVGVSPAGDGFFVGEVSNNRVSHVSAAPAFVDAFGYDVVPGGLPGLETCTANPPGCQGGTSGISAGQFVNPGSVEFMPDGSLAVANLAGIVGVYSPDGGFVRSFSYPGTGAGQMSAPYGMAVDAAGRTAFAEIGNNRLSFYDANGGFVKAMGFDVIPGGPAGAETCTVATSCQGGASGPAAGQLNAPSGAAFAPDGTLYVTELGNSRVSQFSADGQFIRAFGENVIPGGGGGFEICTAATTCTSGASSMTPGSLAGPFGIAVDCRGSVFVTEAGNERVQKFGEPGARLAPCPSNEFEIGKPKLNRKKGTAKLPVEIPGPGELVLAGGKVKGVTQNPTVAGAAKLPIKAKAKAAKKLKRKGKAKVQAKVTFTPVNGDPNTQSEKVKLVRKLRK